MEIANKGSAINMNVDRENQIVTWTVNSKEVAATFLPIQMKGVELYIIVSIDIINDEVQLFV